MNSRERVGAAIGHRDVDRTPRGELWLEEGLIRKLLGRAPVDLKDEISAYKMLGMDLRVVLLNCRVEGSIEELWNGAFSDMKESELTALRNWHEQSELFILAGVNGPFESLCSSVGFKELMFLLKKEPEKVRIFFEKWTEHIYRSCSDIVKTGADGILIADDIAYNQSTYFSRKDMQSLLFPFYKKAVALFLEKNLPVFFHCDGNINELLPDFIEIGFSGLHSLEREANMDILEIRERYGERLCLMGNLSTALLVEGEESEVQETAHRLAEAMGKNGGFILGSSAGVLGAEVPLKNLVAITRGLVSDSK